MTAKITKSLESNQSIMIVFANPEKGETIQLLQSNDLSHMTDTPFAKGRPGIIFPSENNTKAIANMWYAGANPVGIEAFHTKYPWSTVIQETADGKIKYFLRDRCGVIEEITYGHSHHAVYFYDWGQYHEDLESFYLKVKILKGKFEKFCEKVKTKFPGDENKQKRFEAFIVDSYWANNLFLWITNYHAEATRLLCCVERLKNAQEELAFAHEVYEIKE